MVQEHTKRELQPEVQEHRKGSINLWCKSTQKGSINLRRRIVNLMTRIHPVNPGPETIGCTKESFDTKSMAEMALSEKMAQLLKVLVIFMTDALRVFVILLRNDYRFAMD
jgi:hypothetical protein